MPSDTDHGVLRDILRHIELAQRFTRGHTFETFNSDELHLYAVTRCLEVISEASRRLSDELKARHLGISWKQMTGAGNIYRHDYQDVAAHLGCCSACLAAVAPGDRARTRRRGLT
jgi:uncharacterized protein with HEPN domain